MIVVREHLSNPRLPLHLTAFTHLIRSHHFHRRHFIEY